MARQIVFTSRAAKPPATYSQAVKAVGLVFVSGTPTAPRFKNKLDSASRTLRPSLRTPQFARQDRKCDCCAGRRGRLSRHERGVAKVVPANPPARQGVKLPVKVPGLKVSIAAIAEL